MKSPVELSTISGKNKSAKKNPVKIIGKNISHLHKILSLFTD